MVFSAPSHRASASPPGPGTSFATPNQQPQAQATQHARADGVERRLIAVGCCTFPAPCAPTGDWFEQSDEVCRSRESLSGPFVDLGDRRT
ncbi:MAG: hypothetical protein WDW38_003019 [Sanguina aurantia]